MLEAAAEKACLPRLCLDLFKLNFDCEFKLHLSSPGYFLDHLLNSIESLSDEAWNEIL